MYTYEYWPPLVGILLANSAKHTAVIILITPPIKNEMQIEGPAMTSNYPIKRKKLLPILAPSP
jgi:hypothetical protein